MAKSLEKRKNQTEQKRRWPAWLRSVIWSILGVLAAFLIVAILSLPFLWVIARLNSDASSNQGQATEAAQIQATEAVQALTGTAQRSEAETATAQTARATAQAADDQTDPGTQGSVTQTSQAQTEAAQDRAEQTRVAETSETQSDEGEGDDSGRGSDSSTGSESTLDEGQPGSEGESDPPTATPTPDGAAAISPPSLPQAFAAEGVDIYEGPGLNYPVVETLPPDTTLSIIGQNEPGSWWQVRTADGIAGWTPAALVETGDTSGTPLVQDLPQAVAGVDLEVYEGPSQNFPVITTLPANTPLPVVGRNEQGSWWQVETPAGSLGWVPDLQVEAGNTAGTPVVQGTSLVIAGQDVDVHEGPGRNYPIINTLPPNIPLPIVGQNEQSTWWQIEGPDGSTGWVPDLLVDETDTTETPVVQAPPPPAIPVVVGAPSTRGEDYIVQRDDWLSKLSEKFYDNVTAYWPIMAVTNQANADDATYARIDDEDLIEIGDKLRIPSVDDAVAFMADFDPEEDVQKLFPVGDAGQLVVGSWWTAPGEFAALDEIYQRYLAENLEVELVDTGVIGGEVAFRTTALERLAAGNAYDVFLVNAGFEADRYTPAENLVVVADILTDTGLLDALPAAVQTLLQFQGDPYLVPVNIHRGDVMWTNTRLLEQTGVVVPNTFEEFFVACKTLRDQGLVPLALGSADGFELSHTFEVVLAGTVGPDTSNALWNGLIPWSEPGVSQALQNFSRLLDCTNEDRDLLGWVNAINLVINDQAVFNIMGDWAYGEVILKGGLDHVVGSPTPDSQGQFLLIAGGFALPQNAPNPENARAFLELVAQPEVQQAFSQNKGSLCARTDCDYSTFPADRQAYFQSAAADLSTGVIVPMVSHGAGVPPGWQDRVNQIIIQFAADRDIAAAQTALIQAAVDAGVSQ